MIVSVRESKARISELLVKARSGEEVIITVRGEPEARIVPIHRDETAPNMKLWADELRERILGAGPGAKPAPTSSSQEIIDDLRGEH